MARNEHISEARVNTGEQDGVKVYAIPENGVYIVECPNFYDCYWKLTGKMKDTDTYLGSKLKPTDITSTLNPEQMKKLVAEGVVAPEKAETFGMLRLIEYDDNGKPQFKEERAAHIMIPIQNLQTPAQIEAFNFQVLEARKVNVERTQEINRFLFADVEKKQLHQQIKDLCPDNAFVNHNTQLTRHFGKPEKNWVAGQVLAAGKYYVMLHTGNSEKEIEGVTERRVHVQFINTGDMLKGDDWLTKNREKAISELCPEGEFKSFNWSQNSKIRVSDYDPDKSLENKAKKEAERAKYAAVAKPSDVTVQMEVSRKSDETAQEKPVEKKVEPVQTEQQEEKKKISTKSKSKSKEAEMAR
jgi:hypothetical protein